MYEVVHKKGLKYLVFNHLQSSNLVTHGFTTRIGGVSTGCYHSLNTSFHVGDQDARVQQNRVQACRALGIDPYLLVAGRQVHGDRIWLVEEKDLGRGALSHGDALPDIDALITGRPGVPLSSYYADCVPIFILDPVQRVIALAHAGWQGTALKIARKVIEKMSQHFATNPRCCLAGIGPSIGPCCYEVDEPVIGRFRDNFPGGGLAEPAAPGKWRLNLWEANRLTLLEAGLQPDHICTARLCTSCRRDLFFSYRAEEGRTGRMASFMMLK